MKYGCSIRTVRHKRDKRRSVPRAAGFAVANRAAFLAKKAVLKNLAVDSNGLRIAPVLASIAISACKRSAKQYQWLDRVESALLLATMVRVKI